MTERALEIEDKRPGIPYSNMRFCGGTDLKALLILETTRMAMYMMEIKNK